ncbi:MAG: LacI family transcriptional regulator [Chloroflexota bacterium]|nr:LacI family transcriptional regulator [Chloroflexota bacterium]
MNDVAERTGVSKTTISRIINQVPNAASKETVDRVLKAIDELGYYPNQVAASLKRTTTRTIGLVMGDIENPFFGSMIKGVEEVVRSSGYSLILANSNYNDALEQELCMLMMSKQVDAILIAPSGFSSCEQYAPILERQIPIVFIDNYVPNCQADAVVVNNLEASAEACNHLIDLGHKRIAFIAGPESRISADLRTKGYLSAMQASFGQPDEELLQRGDHTVAGGYKCMTELLKLSEVPTAVFVSNNLMTVGALGAIKDAGLSIPSDISILGFDDMYWYSINQPSLTAVDQPAFEIGQTAAKRVVMRLHNKKQPSPETIELTAKLIVRDSTAPPRSHRINPQT